MIYAICCVPVAPVRLQPDHKAEMISQILFGECCTIIFEEKNGWVKIVTKLDDYTGWCQQSHFLQIDEAQYNLTKEYLAADWVNELEYNHQQMFVPLGSSLNGLQKEFAFWQENNVKFTGKIWELNIEKKDAKTIEQIAFKFLNTAYLWGGRSVFGIDCSGFTQLVFKFMGIYLQRDAHQQVLQGEVVSFLQEARCGDLAFFDNEVGHIIHVGILLNPFEIIHASGKVRIDKIDSHGIINIDTNLRTQNLRVIKRFF